MKNFIAYVTVFLVLSIALLVDGRSLKQNHRVKRSGESDAQVTFKLCTANDTFCSGHGQCYQSVDQTTKKICRCDDEYYGPQCENKVDKLMETLVLAVAIFAGVMLIIVIVISLELCRRRRYYEKMKKQLLESRPAEKPTDMYTQRKPSYASSIDEKYDLTPVNGYVKRNSFTPMDDENNQHLKPEMTSPMNKSPKQTKLDEAFVKENQTALDSEDGAEIAKDVSESHEDSSIKSDSDDNKSSDGDRHQERRGRSPTFNNDAGSVTSEAMSLPESERNLIPSPSNQQNPQRPLSENEAYELYLAQRKAQQQQMILPNNGFMAPPQPHHNPQLPQCRKGSSPNVLPSYNPQQRSPLANTPSPNSYNNQVFFNTMQPRTNNTPNLHPQQAGGRRKISTQSNQTARVGAPVSPNRQYEAAKQRQRSPNRANNRGLGQQYNYTDSKGRPLSMTDLRVLEEISRNPGHDRRRARSVEDILALEDRASSEVSVGSGGANNGGRRKRPGMWAQSQGRIK